MSEIKTTVDLLRLCRETTQHKSPREYVLYVHNEEFAELLRSHTAHKIVVVEPF